MNTTAKKNINLIAGTSSDAHFIEIETYRCANYASLADVIALYIDTKKLANTTSMPV
tara:strand:- start:12579 stop:12749 length:171 start_codon:yes stop_codon:yes gene_type:complete